MSVRSERSSQAARLRSEGVPTREIAERLGISHSYARMLTSDPDGAKERARKESYRGTCEKCGKWTDGSNGRAAAPRLCAPCSNSAKKYWTREKIIVAFHEAAAILGRPPTAPDWYAVYPSGRVKYSPERIAEADRLHAAVDAGALRFPAPWVVAREFGSWSNARAAAGYSAAARGRAGHRRHGATQGAAA